MNRLFKVAASLAAIGIVAVSYAVGTTSTYQWLAPTMYVDGVPLPISDIDHYTLTWVGDKTQGGPSGSVNVPGNVLTAVVPVPCGNTTATLSITTTPTAHYPNATSAPTSPVPYASGVACVPNPPSGVVVR
jgi:hypothetical protein